MSAISWNCQGMGVVLTLKALKDICCKHTPTLVFLMETRMKDRKLDRIRRSWNGFNNSFLVDLIGSSGGLAL